VALLLRRRGVAHIRPLQGGLEAWREKGYPMVTISSLPAGDTSLGIAVQGEEKR
jgi:3-mercaptopyruvate sulfurtransferase SseA